MRLTVKAPPSKLRQATSGTSLPSSPSTASTPPTAPVNNARPSRASRNPRKIVEVDTSEEEEEDEDEDEDAEGEEDADAEIDIDEEILAAEDSEPDAEDSDAEADADADMDTDDAAPRPPVIKVQPPSSKSQPDGKMHVAVTAPPHDAPLRSVETAEADDEDEELSELESEGEGEEEDDDGEGEEDELNSDMDDEMGEAGSRSATPDMSKLTRRQRAQYEEFDGGLMALSNEAQKKKHFTAEENAMRRLEMARRRKNLSEKRNEEEKMDTINKLLKKQAPKRRTRAEILAAAAADGTPNLDDGRELPKPDPLYAKWMHNAKGSVLGVPEEWLDGPVGEVFRGTGERIIGPVTAGAQMRGRMVMEVQ
ncbi:hypothetical protein LTR66_011232 [Elasticomyces elasticus]|nr:hypothetical protein LTR66_011232 [Elasticomyces elasticus]